MARRPPTTKEESAMYHQIKIGLSFAAVSIALLSSNYAFAEEKLQPQTRRDLKEAMLDEAFTALRYGAFAEQARQEGKPDLADFLDERSKDEIRHFKAFAIQYGLVGGDMLNVAKAIGDAYVLEMDTYGKMAERAEAAGDKQVAESFRQHAAEEAEHVVMFKAALTKFLKPNKP
jgi:rubrerythrin